MRHMVMSAMLAGLVIGMLGCQMGPPLPEGRLVANKSVVNVVSATEEPTVVDGVLDDAAWANALAMTDFTLEQSDKPEVQSRVLVTYDKDNLYVAVINDEVNTDKLVTNATQRDGNVWSDDSIEIYLDARNLKSGEYHGFFVSASNVVYDRRRVEAWDGKWTSGTSIIEGKAWIAEVAIPFETVGITPKPGHRLGLMVARNRLAGGTHQSLYLVPCNQEAKDTSLYPVLELR